MTRPDSKERFEGGCDDPESRILFGAFPGKGHESADETTGA